MSVFILLILLCSVVCQPSLWSGIFLSIGVFFFSILTFFVVGFSILFFLQVSSVLSFILLFILLIRQELKLDSSTSIYFSSSLFGLIFMVGFVFDIVICIPWFVLPILQGSIFSYYSYNDRVV